MAKSNPKQTSKSVASKASKILTDGRYSAPGHFLVNTCDNAPGSAPECIECVRAAVTRLLKSREQSGYTG